MLAHLVVALHVLLDGLPGGATAALLGPDGRHDHLRVAGVGRRLPRSLRPLGLGGRGRGRDGAVRHGQRFSRCCCGGNRDRVGQLRRGHRGRLREGAAGNTARRAATSAASAASAGAPSAAPNLRVWCGRRGGLPVPRVPPPCPVPPRPAYWGALGRRGGTPWGQGGREWGQEGHRGDREGHWGGHQGMGRDKESFVGTLDGTDGRDIGGQGGMLDGDNDGESGGRQGGMWQGDRGVLGDKEGHEEEQQGTRRDTWGLSFPSAPNHHGVTLGWVMALCHTTSGHTKRLGSNFFHAKRLKNRFGSRTPWSNASVPTPLSLRLSTEGLWGCHLVPHAGSQTKGCPLFLGTDSSLLEDRAGT